MAASSSSAAWTAEEFRQTLEEAGKTLLEPYATVDELLNRLDNLDNLLRLVEQTPPPALEEALKPSKNALIADELLRNDDLNVKVSVVCCICEITRITAPVEPYGDDKMREIFQLLIMIFGKLSSMAGRSYSKAISILDNFAKCQLCMLMWDCDDAFIVEMFQLFLRTIHSNARVNHPPSVISNMEKIMTLIIEDDEEDVPVELFSILIDTLRRENENVSPLSYSMAERVFRNCAVKLKRRLSTAIRLTDIALDDYAEIVARVCNDSEELAPDDDGGTGEVGASVCAPSDSLVNNDAASIRNDDSLKNGISTETLQCLEIEQQKVSVAETNSHCQNSDAIKALQGLESEAIRTPKANEESLKGESSSKLVNACDQSKQHISDATHCSQTEDPDAANTMQEELNAEAVSELKINEDTWKDESSSTSLQCCNQIKLQKSSDARTNALQDAEELAPDDDVGTGEVGISVCAASIGNDDTLKNGISTETLQCLEIEQQKVSVAETTSHCQNSDAIRALQGLESEAVRTSKTNEVSLKDESSSKLLNACDPIEQQNISDATRCSHTEDLDAARTVLEELMQKYSDSRTNAGPKNSDAATLVQQQLDPGSVSIPQKRGRKPNTLIKPEEGYDNSWIRGERKSPYIPRRRRNYRKEISGPSKSSVSKKSSLRSGLARDTQPWSASETQSQSFPHKKRPRKGNPRNEDNMLKEDGDLELLSDSARDLTRTSSDEKASRDGYSRNPEKREGSSEQIVARKQRRDRATTEHIREKSQLKTLPSLSTPKTSTQEFAEAIKAKRKRKHTPLKEEVSELSQAVKDNGERFVGCKIQVYWPLDKMFYKGSVTSFDNLTKKHKVLYEDGEEETLDLTTERWELLEDDTSSDCGQMSVTGAAALHNLSDNHAVNSSGPPIKKHKVSNIASSEHVPTSNDQRLKIVRSKSKLEQGQANDPVTPATFEMKLPSPKPQGRSRSKNLQLLKGKKLLSESIKASSVFSVQAGNGSSEIVEVHGYLMKASSAPILEAIVAKYGDIAANCLYKSPSVRASLLEVVCNVVQRLRTSGITASDINAMISEISDAADAKLEVSWLQQYLVEIVQEEQAAKRSSEVRRTTCLVMKAAEKDFEERQAELVAAQEQLRKAERCVEVLKHVSEQIDKDILESLANEKSWKKRLDELI